MTTAAALMSRAGVLLNDQEHTRWTLPELADWINEAVKAVCLVKPAAHSTTQALELEKGTLQRVPASAVGLIRVVRNLTSIEPLVGGRAVSPTQQEILDGVDPNWHDESRTRFNKTVRQFVFSQDDPEVFYVYPGNDGDGILEVVLATLPAEVAASGPVDQLSSWQADVGLPAIYESPLLDFVLYRANAKDDTAAMPARAAMHFQQFATAMGMKVDKDGIMTPSQQSMRR